MSGVRMHLLAVLVIGWWASLARASGPLPLERLEGEHDLRDRVDVIYDPDSKLTFDDVRAAHAPFEPNGGRVLNHGFDRAAMWMRFEATNDRDQSLRWVLVVGEPTLRQVDLWIVHEDGRTEHQSSGTLAPFSARTIALTDFVFDLEAPAHDDAQYYVRVSSDYILRAPLRAMTPRAFQADHAQDMLLRTLCVGALLLFALYHLGVYALVRQIEDAWFALVMVALSSVELSLHGRFGQFVLPNHPELAHRWVALSLAVAMVAVSFYAYSCIIRVERLRHLSNILLFVSLSALGLVAFAALAPAWLGLRALVSILFVLSIAGPYILHVVTALNIPELQFYRFAWWALIVSIPIAALRYQGLCPDNRFTELVLPIGFIAYGIANSLALASLTKRLRSEIAALNDKLLSNVHELKRALLQAEQANDEAQRATKAKDEFVATMSHELRTPLNTIINIPQGLVTEFLVERTASCSRCDSYYLLDESDRIDEGSLCETCAGRGTLVAGNKVTFRGDDARYLRFLQKIERSGQHLLQMVNGVLDYSKLEAGRFELMLAPLELDPLLREVADQMSDLAQRKSIRIDTVSQPGLRPPIVADGLRIKQVLINLVANAVKFSEPGSTVTVRWRSLPDGEQIDVEDQGIGIAPVDHERVFTSFEQVHKGDTRKYGGTGLGLSISRSLVRMHGGELSLQSELGHGATFSVRLPNMAAGKSASGGETTSAPDAPFGAMAGAR